MPRGIPIVLATVCLAYGLSLAHGRNRQDDFRAYYSAAGRVIAGKPLYIVTDPDFPFLYRYPPSAALAFVPLRLLPRREMRAVGCRLPTQGARLD